jgi:hypothetical protein
VQRAAYSDLNAADTLGLFTRKNILGSADVFWLLSYDRKTIFRVNTPLHTCDNDKGVGATLCSSSNTMGRCVYLLGTVVEAFLGIKTSLVEILKLAFFRVCQFRDYQYFKTIQNAHFTFITLKH